MNLYLGIFSLLVAFLAVAVVAARHREIAGALMAGVAARGAFAFLDNLFLGVSKGGDGRWWDVSAQMWASQGLDVIVGRIDTGHNLYRAFMALLYYFIGHSSLMIQVVNAFFGSLIIVYVWKLARTLGSTDTEARRAAWVIAVFPSTILHSGLLLREAVVTLPLTAGVYHLAAWHRNRRLSDAVAAGAALLLSMAFHSGAFAVMVALTVWVVGSWARSFLHGKSRLLVRNTVALLLAAAAISFAAGTGWGMEKFRRIDLDDVSTLAREQDYASKGRTAYLQDLRADTVGELLAQSPIRVAYFLFAPFPWMIKGMRDVIGFADALLFLWLGWRLLRGRRVLAMNPTALMVVALFFAMAFTFALGVSNYGTAFRHRNKMLPMLAAVSAVVPWRRSHKVRAAMFLTPQDRGMEQPPQLIRVESIDE